MSAKITRVFEVPADLSTLPAPPVPAGLDLRHFDCMHLNTERLLKADIWRECSDAEIATALRFWAAAWQQVPCSSLPNNDAILREIARCEGKAKRWKVVRFGALRGFQLCNDGRIYHHAVAESAINAASKSRAGKRGALARWGDTKPLKNKKTRNATAYGRTDGTLYSRSDGTDDGRTDGKIMQRREEITLPPYPPLGSTAGTGSVDPHPPRPATPDRSAEPEYVQATLPSGAKIKISEFGQVDVLWTPLDCERVMLTRQQALEIRAAAMAGEGAKSAELQGAA